METIEKYYGRQQLITPSGDYQNDVETVDVGYTAAVSIIRRWRTVLAVLAAACVIGVPVIWLVARPTYQATAAIRVAPVIHSILFADKESEGVIPMYKNFVNTQADLIASDKILQRVTDELFDKNLIFFKHINNKIATAAKIMSDRPNAEFVLALRQAITNGRIIIAPAQDSELIKITMDDKQPEEAVQIVNSFVHAYMSVVTSEEALGGDQKLSVLEDESRVLTEKISRQRETIRQMSQEYGSGELQGRHEMMMQRLSALLTEFTKVQTNRVELQAQVEMLEQAQSQNIDTGKLFQMENDFVNADMTVQTLAANVAKVEQSLIADSQALSKDNPELARKAEFLEKLKIGLRERREEIEKKFDEMIVKQANENNKNRLVVPKRDLEQTAAYENRLKAILDAEDSKTVELGRKQLAIQDMQYQLNMTKEYYDAVQKRIQAMDMEKKRPARISVAYEANIAPLRGKRIKYTATLIFVATMLGAGIAILRDRMDKNLYTPEDVAKSIKVRIIGTTTNPDGVQKAILPHQVSNDYQTICANLRLFNGENIPHRLVVTSSCPREGKTTLSINLATNIAQTGKKVLLIDGDLRKPDIAGKLNLPCCKNGLKEISLGIKLEDVVCPGPVAGLDILTAEVCKPSTIYDLLTQKHTAILMEVISQKYDHVIIDSPPALAVPDAFLWAKMADAVVLTSMSGSTAGPDLKETAERFEKINVKVVGTVLNNVPFQHSYNRYGYGYNANVGQGRRGDSTEGSVSLPDNEHDGDAVQVES